MIRKRQVRCLRDEVLKSTMSKNRAENATGVITDANDLMISSSDQLTAISSLRDQNSSFRRSSRRVRRDFGAEIDQMKDDSGDICSSEPIIEDPSDQRHDDDTRANSLSDLDERVAVQAVLQPKKSQPTFSTNDDSSNSLPKFALRVKRRSLFAGLFNAHSAQSLPSDGSRKNSADGATLKIAPDAVRPAGLRRPFHQSLSSGLADKERQRTADKERQRTAARGSKDKSAKNELYFGAPDKTNAEVISLSSLSSTSSSDDKAGHFGADESKTGFIALSMMTLPCLAVRAMTVDLQDDTEGAKGRPTTDNSGSQHHLRGPHSNRAPRHRSPLLKLTCHKEDEILETSDEIQSELEHLARQRHGSSSLMSVHLMTTSAAIADDDGNAPSMMTMTPDPDHKNGLIPNRKRSTTIC